MLPIKLSALHIHSRDWRKTVAAALFDDSLTCKLGFSLRGARPFHLGTHMRICGRVSRRGMPIKGSRRKCNFALFDQAFDLRVLTRRVIGWKCLSAQTRLDYWFSERQRNLMKHLFQCWKINKWNYRSGHLEMLLHTERNSRVGDASLSLSPQLLFLTPVDSDRKYHRKW